MFKKTVKRIATRIPSPLGPLLVDFIRYADYRAAMKGRIANSEAVLERLKESCQTVSCPLILISQVQRSGGSLISQLFDGHSEILAHPHELKIGYPKKFIWPPIDPGFSADKQFKILFERPTIEMSQFGYVKGKKDRNRKNFFFFPQIQREIFRNAIGNLDGPATSRDVLNAYFTSYFNSWLNLRSHISDAKFITGFVPVLSSDEGNMRKFWNAYPDGYLVSIIRSPLSWYPSVNRLSDGTKFTDIHLAARSWNQSTESALREKKSRGDRVIIVHFDDLLANTEGVMRHICDRLSLPFQKIVTRPTFNGELMGANTSFDKVQPGTVSSAPLNRDRHLSNEDRKYLQKHCMPLYERVIDEIVESA